MSANQLTFEQQFEIAALKHSIAEIDEDDLRELFLELYENMLVRDNATKSLLAHQWGIDIGND